MNTHNFFVKRIFIFLLIVGISLVLYGVANKEAQAPEILQYKDVVIVEQPLVGDVVTSPIIVSGEARGTWFFEGDFPVYVVDWDGKIIGQGIAKAEGGWMTTDFVPFSASVTFDYSEISGNYSDRGTLILQKDNPSDNPSLDDAFEIEIMLK